MQFPADSSEKTRYFELREIQVGFILRAESEAKSISNRDARPKMGRSVAVAICLQASPPSHTPYSVLVTQHRRTPPISRSQSPCINPP